MSGSKIATLLIISIVLLGLMLALAACQGPAGAPGPAGSAGATGPQGPRGPVAEAMGTISGTVTSSMGGSPVAGLRIAMEPAVDSVSIQTDNNGKYSAILPVGAYTLVLKKDNYAEVTQAVSVAAGQITRKDIVLKATKPVVVNAGKNLEADPGATVSLSAKVDIMDGSRVAGYKWTQIAGVPAVMRGEDTDKITVTLGDISAYKAKLFEGLKTEDRFGVQAIIPHALVDAEQATFKITVTTSSGNYEGKVNVAANLPWVFSGGIRNVPVDVAVLLHGKKQNSYNWNLSLPPGSNASLDNPSDQNPSFVPDVVGKYTLMEQNSKASFDVFAGIWEGAITGQDDKGRPLSANCTACHDGRAAPDRFTSWKESGHAQILTQNINDPNGHWAINCAECHTVGYKPGAKNNGFLEAFAAEGWKVPSHGDKGLWTTMLEKFPKTTKLANIQCENCHGPNNSPLHLNGRIDDARMSVASDACGSCHGEPPRHGRFQQWEESGHGNFERAMETATVENRGTGAAHCGRCHAAQGFLNWSRQGDLTKQIQGTKGNATVAELTAMGLTKNSVQPQTCVVCHSPHNPGEASSKPNTATVRITDKTPMLPAGFQAVGVGRGAICMTCHNSRNGAHNDSTGNPPNHSAPHTAAQTDILMGENAYFVNVGARSKHSFIKDTCATCHMELTLPPKEFSFNRGGTNHAFEASVDTCKSCHGAFDGGTLQHSVEAKVEELGRKMSAYLMGKIPSQVHVKDYTPHTYQGKSYDVKSNDLTIEKANIASIEPTEPHGQQGFIFKFKNPVTVTYAPAKEAPHTLSTKEVEVQLGDITTDGKSFLIPLSDPLVKAGWNYFLVHGDGSEGVHNPSFVMDVLNASIAALK